MKTKKELYSSRPTSPHLTIYRKQISSVLSIFHRITGAFLFAALSIVTWAFILHIFHVVDVRVMLLDICTCFVQGISIIISLAFFYHISTGVRHLIWDLGYAMSKKALHVTGWIAISFAVTVTVLFSYFIL